MSDDRNSNKNIVLRYFYVTLTAGNRYGLRDTLSLCVLLQVNGENVNNSFIDNGKHLKTILRCVMPVVRLNYMVISISLIKHNYKLWPNAGVY